MLDFNKPKVEDKKWMQPLIEESGCMGADVSFGSVYLWSDKYDTRVAKFEDFFIRATFTNGKISEYYMPVGKGDMVKAVQGIIDDAKEKNIPLRIELITEDMKEFLEKNFKDVFNFTETRDKADYIYLQEDLASLSGRKYHSKRNHISKFKRETGKYKFKKITSKNYEDALHITREWCKHNGDEDCIKNEMEFCAITKAFKNYKELGLMGGILYVGPHPVAMTVASEINKEICDVHFEKALPIVEGSYPVINNKFAGKLSKFKYLNREEDLGIEGLRRAKESYYPVILLRKFRAELVN